MMLELEVVVCCYITLSFGIIKSRDLCLVQIQYFGTIRHDQTV